MRKPALGIFLWPLYSDIIFFIDQYCAGGIKVALLIDFFSFYLDCHKFSIKSYVLDVY